MDVTCLLEVAVFLGLGDKPIFCTYKREVLCCNPCMKVSTVQRVSSERLLVGKGKSKAFKMHPLSFGPAEPLAKSCFNVPW